MIIGHLGAIENSSEILIKDLLEKEMIIEQLSAIEYSSKIQIRDFSFGSSRAALGPNHNSNLRKKDIQKTLPERAEWG